MWNSIKNKFKKYPAQEKVVRLLLEYGFKVNNKGRVTVADMEIPDVTIGKRIGVDRRVVDATCKRIREDSFLSGIFGNLSSIPFLKEVAPTLGLGVIVIEPLDAYQKGLLGQVATKVAEYNISIRQAVSDDPSLKDDPLLTIITESPVSGELVRDLVSIPGVKGVTVY